MVSQALIEFALDQVSFPKVVHKRENNKASQEILDNNKERLNKACEKVNTALLNGVRLSGYNIYQVCGIFEIRRRIKDLIDAGYPVKHTSLKGGIKEWYYDQDYIKANKINLMDKL